MNRSKIEEALKHTRENIVTIKGIIEHNKNRIKEIESINFATDSLALQANGKVMGYKQSIKDFEGVLKDYKTLEKEIVEFLELCG